MTTIAQRFVMVLVTLSGVVSGASASQLPDYPSIHTTGVASTYVNPDIGSISFDITVSDADAEQAALKADRPG